MKLAYFQFAPVLRDPDRNRTVMTRALDQLDADLVVFPELSNSGYNFSCAADLHVAAEPSDRGETVSLWRRTVADRNMIVVGGFAERCGDECYNSAALATPAGDLYVYRKIHLFGTEPRFFSPGCDEPAVYDVNGVRIGMMICFDWAFPETARVLALKGAQIICHPSNIVTTVAQRGMTVRSLENRVFSITANRTGDENGVAGPLHFQGRSQIVSPTGEVLACSGEADEEWRVAEIDPTTADDKMLAGLVDMFAARRPELYSALTRRA